MLYRIEYRYFYYDRDITQQICHVKMAVYAEFENEPTNEDLVNYFNENLINKDKDIYRNKLYVYQNKIDDKEEIYVEDLDIPADIIVEKVLANYKCYVTSGAGFRTTTSLEGIKSEISEEYKKYGDYAGVKDMEDFKRLSKKRQERLLDDLAEMHEREEMREYSKYNLSTVGTTLETWHEIKRFLRGV